MKNKTRYIWIIPALLGAAVVVALYGYFDPMQFPFPKCAVYANTGIQCPGCGSQRAIHQLMNGNLIEALRLNLVIFVAMIYFFLIGIHEFLKSGSRIKVLLSRVLYGRGMLIFWVVFILVYTVLRNLF